MLTRRENRFIAIALKATLLVTAGAVLFMPKIDFDLSTFSPNYLVGTVQAAEAPPPVTRRCLEWVRCAAK
ncbi:hypothetical protein GCM10010862_26910 [Devosia nitrariae]|uniref:Uncharacterized protein n=1 Tax=Devosia nitrariae TaxID=2071872 RepID=A0ABQ5W6D7_9HYPH|nr:hypothetical protein GCM10010862_26910 [Devosia nitrariae]